MSYSETKEELYIEKSNNKKKIDLTNKIIKQLLHNQNKIQQKRDKD